MDNLLFDPELNPVIFYEEDRAVSDIFQTPHFENFPFEERGQDWLQKACHFQVWQITDIIKCQFESMFNPIIVELLDINDNVIITLPALIGLPHLEQPNTWAYEISMSLATVSVTGMYRLRRTLGSAGPTQKKQYTKYMYISTTKIEGTIYLEYWHSRFFKDVMFESGIRFAMRVFAWIDYDRQNRVTKQELYRDESYNQTILNSKSSKVSPVYFGDEFGMPTDITNIIELAHECDHVMYDDKYFTIAEGAKMEFFDQEGYRMRGLHTLVEPGINRNSRIFAVEANTNKKLLYSIWVDKKATGDTGLQSSSNTIPVLNEE